MISCTQCKKTCTVICTVNSVHFSELTYSNNPNWCRKREQNLQARYLQFAWLHDTRYYAAMLSIMICNMYLDISRRKQYKLIRLYCYYHSCARSFAYACLNSCSRGTSEKFSFWQCLHLCTACINLYACKPTAPHSLSLVRFFGLALVQI